MYTDPEKTVQTYTDNEPNGADFPLYFFTRLQKQNQLKKY
jgi:hypothetical protein